jgi:hypothetical protein
MDSEKGILNKAYIETEKLIIKTLTKVTLSSLKNFWTCRNMEDGKCRIQGKRIFSLAAFKL